MTTWVSRGLAVAVAGAAVGGSLLLYADSAGSGARQTFNIDLSAAPRTIDEGDLVEFVAEVSESNPASPFAYDSPGRTEMFTWTLDDGSPPASGLGLGRLSHRFLDGGAGGTQRNVRLRVGASQKTITVAVNNVAPTIRNLSSTKPAVRGQPVAFEVSATDPGARDIITYTWDFADGGTATGQQVTHAFAADGVYQVTVTANDGDDGEDTATLRVSVGTVGSFTVSGDISLPETNVNRFDLIGTGGNVCAFRLAMYTDVEGLGMTLTASLRPGLGVYGYPIALNTEWDGATLINQSRTGVFFADFSPPNTLANRDFGGRKVGGPFWSRGGTVTVEYFDGKLLELSYSATLIENIPAEYNPRTVFVEGSISSRVSGRAGLGTLIRAVRNGMNTYDCGRDETRPFELERQQPVRNATNVSGLNPQIEMTFTQPVDPASIAKRVVVDRRVWVVGGAQAVQYNLPVEGTWEMMPGDAYTIRFVPQSRLEDGVVFCARVRAGLGGLRSRDGSNLTPVTPSYPSAAIQRACGASPPFMPSVSWAFSTQVVLESAHVDVYQASQVKGDTPLAPNKSTVSRVYTQWSPPEQISDDAQVKRFQARVRVRANGRDVYPPKRVWVTRPDQFDAEDARNARNSINFYDWRATGLGSTANVQTIIEFIDQSGSVLDTFDGPVETLKVWNRTEILSFDYYYLNVDACVPKSLPDCDWSSNVNAQAHLAGRTLARDGALFATQNFPVIETQARSMGDLWINEPSTSGPCSTLFYNEQYRCYFVGQAEQTIAEDFLAERLYQAALNSYADVVVGFVPPGFALSWVGLMVPFQIPGKRVVMVELGEADVMAIPHEFGHFFELPHCASDSTPACDYWIQGMRVSPSGRSAANKHDIEGNQEATFLAPLMTDTQMETEEVFISGAHYLKLFETIANAPSRQARALPPTSLRNPVALLANLFRPVTLRAQAPAADGRLYLHGTMTAGRLTLDDVLHQRGEVPPRPSAPDADGDLTLELLNATGRVLRTMPFRATRPTGGHGLTGGPAAFFLDVPAPAGLHAVRVVGPGGLRAERVRSVAPPALDVQTPGLTGDQRTLRWSASDLDGDDVVVSVYLRADGETSWRGIVIDTTRTELSIPAARLPSGRQVTARIVASDGFNSTAKDVDLGRGAPVAIEKVAPVDGSTDVPVTAELSAWVSSALAVAPSGRSVLLETGQFKLEGPDGKAVFADVSVQPGTGLLLLVPVEPLTPGTRYTATIEGLVDLSGSRLSAPVTWSFVTAR